MAITLDLKRNEGYLLVLETHEVLALEKLLGSLTTQQCLELGLSEQEDRFVYNIYRALPERDDLL